MARSTIAANPTPTPLAANTTPRDPQRTIRPDRHADTGQHDAVTHWQALLDAGLIGYNPPAPPAVVAQREANAALFRSFARDRARARGRG